MSEEEADAEKVYNAAYSQWAAANRRRRAEEYRRDAAAEDAETERLRRRREAFQARRVAELDAVREERKRRKAENTPAADAPAGKTEGETHVEETDAGGGGGH